MSSDRLFRVRAKQPYSSNAKCGTSEESEFPLCVREHISVGDICVFLECGKGDDEWTIGKILQFSYYQEKTKKARQYRGTTINVAESQGIGILCSWYAKLPLEPRSFMVDKELVHSYVPYQTYLCTILTSDCLEACCSSDVSSMSGLCNAGTNLVTMNSFKLTSGVITY